MVLVYICAIIIGATLGFFGGGGAILTVPLLHYIVGMSITNAIATSLIIISIASIGATWQQARYHHVQWKSGLLIGLTGMVGSVIGAQLSIFLPPQSLLLILAAIMLSSGLAMLCNRFTNIMCDINMPPPSMVKIILTGSLIGIITGLVGAGGGFLVVPTLVLFFGLSMHQAIGTSLFVIALNTTSGALSHLSIVTLDFQLLSIIATLAIFGTWIGGRLARNIKAENLRKQFAFIIIFFALLLFIKELPSAITHAWYLDHWLIWSFVALAIIVSMFYFLTRRCLSRNWRVPFIDADD